MFQNLFQRFPLVTQNVLIRLTLCHWQPYILQLCDIITKISTSSIRLHVSGVVAKFSD